jgi:hypothetical protein
MLFATPKYDRLQARSKNLKRKSGFKCKKSLESHTTESISDGLPSPTVSVNVSSCRQRCQHLSHHLPNNFIHREASLNISSSQTESSKTPEDDDKAPNATPADGDGDSKGPSPAIDKNMGFLEHSSASGRGSGIGGGNGESGDQDMSSNCELGPAMS